MLSLSIPPPIITEESSRNNGIAQDKDRTDDAVEHGSNQGSDSRVLALVLAARTPKRRCGAVQFHCGSRHCQAPGACAVIYYSDRL